MFSEMVPCKLANMWECHLVKFPPCLGVFLTVYDRGQQEAIKHSFYSLCIKEDVESGKVLTKLSRDFAFFRRASGVNNLSTCF